MRTNKVILGIIILAVASFGLNGCSLLKKRVDKTEKQEFKLNSAGKKKVLLTNTNGDLVVKKSDDSTIKVTAEKKGKVKFDEKDKPLENINVTVDTTGEQIKITTDIRSSNGLFKHDKGGEVNFEIYLPAGLSLDIDNTNGELRFNEVSGDIKIDHINGTIGFSKCTGYIGVKSVTSDISGNFDSTKGIDIEMINGDVKLGSMKNISAKFDVEAEHGKVTFDGLNMSQQTANRLSLYGTQGDGKYDVKIRIINGKISLSGTEVRVKGKGDKNKWNFNIDFDDDDERDKHTQPSETKSNATPVDSVKRIQPNSKTNDSAKGK